MAKSVDPNKARQGRRGWQVLVILVVALALLLLGWWFVGYYGMAIAPEDPIGETPTEQTDGAAPAPRTEAPETD